MMLAYSLATLHQHAGARLRYKASVGFSKEAHLP